MNRKEALSLKVGDLLHYVDQERANEFFLVTKVDKGTWTNFRYTFLSVESGLSSLHDEHTLSNWPYSWVWVKNE